MKSYKDEKLLTSSKAAQMESTGKVHEVVIEKMEKRVAKEYTCEDGREKLATKPQPAGKIVF